MASLVAQMVKNLPAVQETQLWSVYVYEDKISDRNTRHFLKYLVKLQFLKIQFPKILKRIKKKSVHELFFFDSLKYTVYLVNYEKKISNWFQIYLRWLMVMHFKRRSLWIRQTVCKSKENKIKRICRFITFMISVFSI